MGVVRAKWRAWRLRHPRLAVGGAVLLAVPFSLVGAFWLLYFLHYNLSVAVWVGLIALAGLDAETGVVMLLYLDHAWDKFRAAGRLNALADLHDAIIEGASKRVRPVMMTALTAIFGLLPAAFSTRIGAQTQRPLAIVVVGGMISTLFLTRYLMPLLYSFYGHREPPSGSGGMAH